MTDVLTYLDSAHRAPDPLLVELEERARKDGVPTVSRTMGRLLSTLVHGMQANRILEVGTAYGFATLWMALAQPPAGKIWTIDPDRERTDVAVSYIRRAGEDEHIEVFNQPALDFLPTFPHRNLDIVFIDAEQSEYRYYLDLAIPLLKLSGLVIVNDCLELRDFNEYFLRNEYLDATILPFGAGIGARIR